MNINGTYMMDHEVIRTLERSFPEFESSLRNKKTYRIRFNGKFITLENGKTSWNTLYDAEYAFINHLNGAQAYDFLKLYNYSRNYNRYALIREDVAEAMIDALKTAKILEFVEITE